MIQSQPTRHVNRTKVNEGRARRPETDSPTDLSEANFDRVVIGRYIDLSKKIKIDNSSGTKRTSEDRLQYETYGEYVDELHDRNHHASLGNFSVLESEIFVVYAEVTDVVNEGAVRFSGRSLRRITKERNQILQRLRKGLQHTASGHSSEIDVANSDMLNEIMYRHEFGYDDYDTDFIDRYDLQNGLSAMRPMVWGGEHFLMPGVQPIYSNHIHPNGDYLSSYPLESDAENTDIMRGLHGVLKSMRLSLPSNTATRQAITVPVFSLGRSIGEIPLEQRPESPRPPYFVPVLPMQILTFEHN